MTLLGSLVATSARVGASASRLVKVRELAALLRSLAPEEIAIAVHYLSGAVPQGRFGLGYRALQSAVEADAAQASATEASLSLADVDQRITAIATLEGAGSTGRRAAALAELFGKATSAEQDFIVRLLTGELRQGALAGVMVDAIAAAADVPAAQVRRAAMYAEDLGALARVALTEGAQALEQFQLHLFSPVVPMLAQTAVDVDEALRELQGDILFEWKMDGARIQVHKSADTVRIYTRALNEITNAIPEVVDAVRKLPVRESILDGEVIAFSAAGRPHPFQITMRRFGRKLDVDKLLDELPVRAYFFDCLLLEGRSLADLPLRERSLALQTAVPADMRMPNLVTASQPDANAFYEGALAAGHEGIMAKQLDSPYEAGNRGASWLKIKRVHTLDLVVLAAEWGNGRREGKLSNLHLGALDPATGEYVMLGKTFKGLTDAMLEWQTREFLARETHRDRLAVYVRPELVVEIAFSDLQASPRYPGGYALRLARVKRYRDDKPAAEADTMESIRRIFAAQG